VVPLYARADTTSCDLSDMTAAHWFYSPKGPRPSFLRDVWTAPPNPRWYPDNCPSFNRRLAEAKASKPSLCLVSSPHTRRLCHRMKTEQMYSNSTCREGERHEKAVSLIDAGKTLCPTNTSMLVFSLIHHRPDGSHAPIQSVPHVDLPNSNSGTFTVVLATLAADPTKVSVEGINSLKSRLAISPYLQRLYSESWKESVDRSRGGRKIWYAF